MKAKPDRRTEHEARRGIKTRKPLFPSERIAKGGSIDLNTGELIWTNYRHIRRRANEGKFGPTASTLVSREDTISFVITLILRIKEMYKEIWRAYPENLTVDLIIHKVCTGYGYSLGEAILNYPPTAN